MAHLRRSGSDGREADAGETEPLRGVGSRRGVGPGPRSGVDADGTERGQLLLVTALAVALGIVALVLLLNTAIYTQNLASREYGTGGDAALVFRQEAVSGAGGILDRVNGREYPDYATLTPDVTENVSRLGDVLERRYAGRGTSVRTAVTDSERGFLFRQTDASRDLTGPAGAPDWSVVSGARRSRGYELRVDPDAGTGPTDAFTVNVTDTIDDSGTDWRVYVYEDGSDVVVAVQNESDPQTEVYRTAADNVTIDLTAGTVDGTYQPKLAWAKNVPTPYRVQYRNGDLATGTYNLTVRQDVGTVPHTAPGPGVTSPYHVPALYSLDLRLRYRSPDLTYDVTARVAPGEADG